jgi:hypothetical protein
MSKKDLGSSPLLVLYYLITMSSWILDLGRLCVRRSDAGDGEVQYVPVPYLSWMTSPLRPPGFLSCVFTISNVDINLLAFIIMSKLLKRIELSESYPVGKNNLWYLFVCSPTSQGRTDNSQCVRRNDGPYRRLHAPL